MQITNKPVQFLSKLSLKNKSIRYAILIFMVVVILFIALWARAFTGSVKNFNMGEKYFHNQQYIKAITFFERSMHWYTPLNPYISRSAEYLWEIGKLAQQINDEQLSLIAFEAIRNSFYSSRSIYSPGMDWIERSENGIDNIVKNQKEISFQDLDNNRIDMHKSIMEYNDPNIFWTIVLEIGLFGWIGSVLGFILLFLRDEKYKSERILCCSYWFWILLVGGNYSLFIIGMVKA